MSIAAENAIDRAKVRLDAMGKAEGDCQTAIEGLLATVQAAVGCSDSDRLLAIECMWEVLAEMTEAARSAVEDEISDHERRIEDAEWRDLNRSSPVVL